MHDCENAPHSHCCQMPLVSHMQLWKSILEEAGHCCASFFLWTLINKYGYFFTLFRNGRAIFIIITVSEKKNPSGTGAQIINANVAINSWYAAHTTGWPSVEERVWVEFKCGAQRGGKQAAAVNLEIITALSDGGAVHVKHQLTDFIC